MHLQQLFAIAGILLALGSWPGRAPAQQVPDTVLSVDSIRVTVLRGEIGLARAPYPVTILDKEALQLGNTGFSIDEALQGVPGVQIQNRYNFSQGERISIRGFGARAQFGIRGLKVLVDGIPATLPDGQSTLDHLDLGSLGRVEILRGPAAALYGNAGGGVLSFSTAVPPDVTAREEAKAVFGQDGLVRLQSTTSGTKSGFGYLVNVAHLSWGGFRTMPDDPSEFYGEADRLNINTQLSSELGGGVLRVTANFFDQGAENAGSLPRSLIDEGSVQAWGFNVNQGSGKDSRQGQLGVRWSGPVGGLRGEVSGWGLFRKLDNPIPPRYIDLDRKAFGGRALLSTRPATRPGEVTFLGGVEMEFQRDDRVNYRNEGGTRGTLTLDQRELVDGLGLFVQARAPFTERLSGFGALRYDRFRFEAEDRFTSGDPDDSGDRTMDALSPTVGLHLQASPQFAVYANVATSLNTPTTTELANRLSGQGGFNPELEPSRGVTGELGVRGRFEGRVFFEVNGWITEIDDELVPFEDESQQGRTFFRNAGRSTYEGVESVLRMSLPAGVRGHISYTFVDAVFAAFEVDGEVYDGNLIPGLAKHRLDAGLTLRRGTWFGEVRGDYVGRIPVDDGNTEYADSYGLIELRTGLDGLAVGRAEISPFVGASNLFDRSYIASVTINAFGGRFFGPGPGRVFYGGLSVAF
jgi:iron complex outermembrane recepter protein